MITFKEKLNTLFDDYNKLITSKNVPLEDGNGILTLSLIHISEPTRP